MLRGKLMSVSVIIPVFNTLYEDLIRCLDSIIAQTIPNFEIIIVDDGSEPAYGKILDTLEAKDSRIKVFHKNNEGVSVARNFGVEKSTGEYILFVDGDDLLTPWLLESALTTMEKEKCDVVVGKIKTTNERPNKFLSRTEYVKFELLDSSSKREELECHIFAKNCDRWKIDQEGWEFNGEGCWAHFLKREVAVENKFIPGIAVGEDTIWALRMLSGSKKYRIGMLYEKWYYYIQNDYSVLNKYNPRIVEQLTMPVEILDREYGFRTGKVYDSYTDWILMKLKQICYRAYLAEENTDSFRKKTNDLSMVIHKTPWNIILSRVEEKPFKKKIKFLLYKNNIMLYAYVIVKKYREIQRKKQSRSEK